MQSPESNPGCYNVDEAGAVRKGTFQLWLRVWGSIQGGVEGRGNKEGICTSSTDHWTSDCGWLVGWLVGKVGHPLCECGILVHFGIWKLDCASVWWLKEVVGCYLLTVISGGGG